MHNYMRALALKANIFDDPDWVVMSYGSAQTGRRYDLVWLVEPPMSDVERQWIDESLMTKLTPKGVFLPPFITLEGAQYAIDSITAEMNGQAQTEDQA